MSLEGVETDTVTEQLDPMDEWIEHPATKGTARFLTGIDLQSVKYYPLIREPISSTTMLLPALDRRCC